VLDGEKQLGFRGGVLDWRGEQVILVGFGAERETDGRILGWTLSGCCCVDSMTNRQAPQ
jgi:hypothetical protein